MPPLRQRHEVQVSFNSKHALQSENTHCITAALFIEDILTYVLDIRDVMYKLSSVCTYAMIQKKNVKKG